MAEAKNQVTPDQAARDREEGFARAANRRIERERNREINREVELGVEVPIESVVTEGSATVKTTGETVLALTVTDAIGARNIHILDSLRPSEPIVIFRAKDILSTMVLIEYLNLVEKYGTDTELQAAILEKIEEFKAWQKLNPQSVGLPD